MSDRTECVIFQWVKERGEAGFFEPRDSKAAGLEVFESATQRHDLLAVRKVRSSKQGIADLRLQTMHRIGCTDVLDTLAHAATYARQKGRGKRKIPRGPIIFNG